jgi:hypothetical protein
LIINLEAAKALESLTARNIDDRFSINTKKQVWNCRKCGAGGDLINLVKRLDGCGFEGACETLTGEPPPRTNGHAGEQPKKVVVETYSYHDADAVLADWASATAPGLAVALEPDAAPGQFVFDEHGACAFDPSFIFGCHRRCPRSRVSMAESHAPGLLVSVR